jgi:WXG100 family type VII secretion target
MPKANVDPEELRRFARELNQFNTEVEALVSRVRAKLRQLEQNWDDQEQHKFTAEFDVSMKALSHFLEVSREYVPFLTQKAKHIEDYLGRH